MRDCIRNGSNKVSLLLGNKRSLYFPGWQRFRFIRRASVIRYTSISVCTIARVHGGSPWILFDEPMILSRIEPSKRQRQLATTQQRGYDASETMKVPSALVHCCALPTGTRIESNEPESAFRRQSLFSPLAFVRATQAASVDASIVVFAKWPCHHSSSINSRHNSFMHRLTNQ